MTFEWRGARDFLDLQLDLIALAAADACVALDHLRRILQQRMPQPDWIRAIRGAGHYPRSLLVRAPERRRGGHHDVREHVVVNVAAERDDARLVEHHRRMLLAAIQGQL